MVRAADQPGSVPWGGPGYFTLPVVHGQYPDGAEVMVSAWEFDPDEVAMINKTGRVFLIVQGSVHPPVLLTTEPPFDSPVTAASVEPEGSPVDS